MTTRYRDGTIRQSGQHYNPDDYAHERIAYPVLGVVLNVYLSDTSVNRSAVYRSIQRGSYCECEVLIINDGTDTPWVVPNAVVVPRGASGVDDYQEEIPKPSTQTIKGQGYNGQIANIDVADLDGDWVLVAFVGGSIMHPFILDWWPHPSNNVDPSTSGAAGNGVLVQGRRSFKRYQGAKLTITNQGSLYVDTNESNYLINGSKDGLLRKRRTPGGDIQVDVKKERQFEVNFNTPVPNYTNEPSLPQMVDSSGKSIGNPPPVGIKTRENIVTRTTLNRDLIELSAGKVARVTTNGSTVQIDEDGSILSVDNNGSMIFIDARSSSAGIKVIDATGNNITMDTDGIAVVDKDGSSVVLSGDGIAIVDKIGSSVVLSADGTVQVAADSVIVNGAQVDVVCGSGTFGQGADSFMVRGSQLQTIMIAITAALSALNAGLIPVTGVVLAAQTAFASAMVAITTQINTIMLSQSNKVK